MRNKILALCGGIGGSKLAFGLSKVLSSEELFFLVNTGDDFIHYNLKICPDLDTLMYTLAGINDRTKGWGVQNESWKTLEKLKFLGDEPWFQLGDKDLATHLRRTSLLNEGRDLSSITLSLSNSFGVKHKILPMSETPVSTMLLTDSGRLSFQEYFVKLRCKPKVKSFEYMGKEEAKIPKLLSKLMAEDVFSGIIICPSNPYLSIDPILSIDKINQFIKQTTSPILTVSPIINNESVKGPTSKIMKELGEESSVKTIADHYKDITDLLMIDTKDRKSISGIHSIQVKTDSIYMQTNDDKISLAKSCLDILQSEGV